ncbi:hypothetical protein MPH_09965 [Macrophomina phaseolina MS6]|uniref:Uncharacterized protein n=2 Tax=Macrophomina phaseolina TaxID=35725 RepID=K2RJ02_MACPH|nr:hypothetical protein MPH_09965 [Macrophomina phaseolina MS6]KAH7032373.1 hypothetical protein B0J12DRAFT_680386 [Macrophomina phaseolina]
MPFKPLVPILHVESTAIHTVDTRSAEQLFGLWSVFSKCAETMEEGRRLENLSWRLWNRETFCCAPEHNANTALFTTPRWSYSRKTSDSGSLSIPALSSSVESDDSDERVDSTSTLQSTSSSRPHIRRHDSTESRNRGTEKHITPIDLESLVISIKEKKELEPLAPLPMASPELKRQECEKTEQPAEQSKPPPANAKPQMVPESSTSTVATAIDSDLSKMSPPVVGSDTSTSTDCSSHSVVRGFSPGRVSSSYRSRTNLHQPTMPAPIIKQPQHTHPAPVQKKKGAMFTLGGSSDEDGNSSLETHMQMSQMSHLRSSLSDGLKRPSGGPRKQTSFKDELSSRIPEHKAYESEEVFESDSDEEEVSESAIEDDDEDQWEDSDDESGPSSVNDKVSFQRVDSKPNLTSRRSLLTTLMHEGDRAQALQNAASRSTPALRRSRTSSPNGPSVAASPNTHTLRYQPEPENQIPRSKPIIMTTSNTHAPPALSPRTTRRNMLTTELTESLRKHLLWERQQKNSTNNAVLKRRHTSTDVKNLKNYPGEAQPSALPTVKENAAKGNNSWTTNYFDTGLQEYHERGW